MSDRDPFLPERAFGSLLSSMQRRLDVLDRRSRWPGAAKISSPVPINPVGLAENTAAGSWPIGHDLTTVTMDPGRWILLANLNPQLIAISYFDAPPGATVGGRIRWTDGVDSGERDVRLLLNHPLARGFTPIALEVTSTRQITATLNGYGGYNLTGWVDPTGNLSLFAPTLIAFPA